jgi:RNA polymerase sigma-70 factor, ECF subfamily
VNGVPGVVFATGGSVIQVTALSISADVQAVYISVNPDKLARWSAAEVE